MFKTYSVADSLMQMNLFMALQVCRMTNLGYLAGAQPCVFEPEEEAEQAEDLSPFAPKHRSAA